MRNIRLNGYTGLDPDINACLTSVLFDGMRARAVALGGEIVAAEQALDAMFTNRGIDRDSLRARVTEIAGLEGELRFAHLSTHLEMRAILTGHQVALYDRMRGYAPDHAPESHQAE